MKQDNIFDKYNNGKNTIKVIAEKAKDNNWITESEQLDVLNKLESDKLTIGVIGQMKSGKSTFLNAFLFGEELLPVATTPMTAALSIITYGTSNQLEVEFYDEDEWDNIISNSKRQIMEDDSFQASEIKAAKELVSKAINISNIDTLLGTKKTDDLSAIEKYVGADGYYSAITKLVSIQVNKEWLRGIEIVDTPGFNDPIVSREQRTKDFLRKADAVLLLLYAGRAFDATDRDILFDKLKSVGIGKILIGVNKYDVNYEQGETVEEMVSQVKDEIRKAKKLYGNPDLNELLNDLEPVPFSANMALLSKLPERIIAQNETYNFHRNRYYEIFEISSHDKLYDFSRIGKIEEGLMKVIESSKYEILLKKPLMLINSKGEQLKDTKESQLKASKESLKRLDLSDSDIEIEIKKTEKLKRDIERLLNRSLRSLKKQLNNLDIEDGFKDKVDELCNYLYRLIDGEKGEDKIIGKINDEIFKFENRVVSNFNKKSLGDIIEITEEVFRMFILELNHFLFEYNDFKDILEDYKDKIESKIHEKGKNQNKVENEEQKKDDTDNIGFFEGVAIAALFPFVFVPSLVINKFNYKNDLRDYVRSIKDYYYAIDIEANFNKIKEEIVVFFREDTILSVLDNIDNNLKEAQKGKNERDQKVEELKNSIKQLEDEIRVISDQINDFKIMKSQLD